MFLEMVLGEVQNLDPSSLLHKVESLLEEAEDALKIDADLGEIESRVKSLALQTHTVTCQNSRSKLEVNFKKYYFFIKFYFLGCYLISINIT